MIGDRLVITEYHRAAARQVHDHVVAVHPQLPVAVSVSGESGCGKSETAHCLMELFEADGRRCVVLGQDDYFRLPPRTNHQRRIEDLSGVGTGEVDLALLDEHVVRLKGEGELVKPLVHFDDDRIGTETVAGPYDVVIAEGTYAALLASVDVRAFIDRDYRQTKKARLTRGRDPDLAFLEQVLEIEHRIISRHRALAQVVILAPPEERRDS